MRGQYRVCQELVSLILLGNSLKKRIKQYDEIAWEFDTLLNVMSQILQHTRALSHGFSMEVDWENFQSKIQELAEFIEVSADVKCRVDVEISEAEQYDKNVAQQFYFIAQEAIGNAIKHAECEKIDILLVKGDDQWDFTITTDGKSFDADKEKMRQGLGLRLMKFRAEQIGGEFSIQAGRRGGAVAQCIVPLRKSASV
ncbi:MAG: sensor histidine kinase [Verrucomicrobiota bacterium]